MTTTTQPAATVGDLPGLTVEELKAIARSGGLRLSGTKADLIARITESIEPATPPETVEVVWVGPLSIDNDTGAVLHPGDHLTIPRTAMSNSNHKEPDNGH